MEQPGTYHSIQNEEDGRCQANGLAIITRLVYIARLINDDRAATGALSGDMTVRLLLLLLLARAAIFRV